MIEIKFLNLLNKNGINCRPVWKLNAKAEKCIKIPQKSNLSNAIKLEKSVICLPSSAEYWQN